MFFFCFDITLADQIKKIDKKSCIDCKNILLSIASKDQKCLTTPGGQIHQSNGANCKCAGTVGILWHYSDSPTELHVSPN